MSNEQIFGIVFASLVVFVLIREVICWYFKINERVKLLKALVNEQIKTNAYLSVEAGVTRIDLSSKHD